MPVDIQSPTIRRDGNHRPCTETSQSVKTGNHEQQTDDISFKSNSSIYNTPTKQRNALQSRLNEFGSPLLSSASSLNSSPQRSRRFDERIRSRFSSISRLASESSIKLNPLAATATQNHKNPTIPPTLSYIKWIDLRVLNNKLHIDETRVEYGEPTCIIPGDLIAIGTSRGYILIFDYKQRLIHTLGSHSQQSISGAVVTLALSLDSTHIASGMANGAVFVWDLRNTTKALIHIPPLREVSEIADGHIEGSSITNLCFVGRRRTVLISGDVHGMVILHRIHKRVLGVTCSSKRVLGHYRAIKDNTPVTILGCAALPLGEYVDQTEEKGLVAIMNQNAMVIVSTKDLQQVKTEFSTGKPTAVDTRMGNTGCLAWFPACLLKDGSKLPAKLVYCFDNVLTVIEVSGSGFLHSGNGNRKDNDTALSFRSRKRWSCDELIVGVQWINSTLLGVITHTQSFIIINEKSMIPSKPLDLLARHIFSPDIYSHMVSHQAFRANFNPTFRTYKGKLFIVGRYEVLIGSLPTWIDMLMEFVTKKDYVNAIETAMKYYKGEEIDLDSVALPLNDDVRHGLVLNYLKDMINVSISQVLTTELFDDELHELLHVSIKALTSVNAESVVLEELYELIRLRSLDNVFFDALESFVLSGQITKLTATVLNDMITYYSYFGKCDQLERIIFSLDITTIDIDSSLSTLKKKGLIDSCVYIWNTLLKDYVTPLLEMIQGKDERAFGYLAYVLTGRQYPTENMIDDEKEAEDAKLSIYYLLFNGTYVTQDRITAHGADDTSSSFPYLRKLLDQDSNAFLSAFNEIFEDSLLNDDEIIHHGKEKLKVNRQFIIDILIEVFEDMVLTAAVDGLNLSIFIARNYPKFQQFIRLSESILDSTVKELCSYTTSTSEIDPTLKDDCELSLQSLLSVYQPPNKTELLDFFTRAGFYEILINLYLNDKKFSKVLSTWLLQDSTNSIESTAAVLERCFKSTEKDKAERTAVVEVVKENFEIVIEADTTNVVSLFNKYCPSLHEIALDLESVQLKYLYLTALAHLERKGKYRMRVKERTVLIEAMSKIERELIVGYLKSLSQDDFDFEETVKNLRGNHAVDALVYLFDMKGDHEESINEIIGHLEGLIASLDKGMITQQNYTNLRYDGVEKELWKYLLKGINIANSEIRTGKSSLITESGLSRDESLWLKLINFIVAQLKKYDSESSKSMKTTDIIKRLLQDLFTSLINTHSKISHPSQEQTTANGNGHVITKEAQTSFLKIFATFLNSPSTTTVTELGDIRSITREIYLAFTYEKHALTITSNLLNEVIYSNINGTMQEAAKGWSVKHFECEACGKVIWGRGISSDAFIEWGRKKGIMGFEELQGNNEGKLDLVSFDCGHCYHLRCIRGLGDKKEELKCVLCHER